MLVCTLQAINLQISVSGAECINMLLLITDRLLAVERSDLKKFNLFHWLALLRKPQACANLTTLQSLAGQNTSGGFSTRFLGTISKILGSVHGTDRHTDRSRRMCPLINGVTGAWQLIREATGPSNHVWGLLSKTIVRRAKMLNALGFSFHFSPCCCESSFHFQG